MAILQELETSYLAILRFVVILITGRLLAHLADKAQEAK